MAIPKNVKHIKKKDTTQAMGIVCTLSTWVSKRKKNVIYRNLELLLHISNPNMVDKMRKENQLCFRKPSRILTSPPPSIFQLMWISNKQNNTEYEWQRAKEAKEVSVGVRGTCPWAEKSMAFPWMPEVIMQWASFFFLYMLFYIICLHKEGTH